MQLINDTMELLKVADQHFVDRLVSEANVSLIYLKKLREAANTSELAIAAQEYTTAFVNLAKRLAKRIESNVLLPEQKQNAVAALEVLRVGIFYIPFLQSFSLI